MDKDFRQTRCMQYLPNPADNPAITSDYAMEKYVGCLILYFINFQMIKVQNLI